MNAQEIQELKRLAKGYEEEAWRYESAYHEAANPAAVLELIAIAERASNPASPADGLYAPGHIGEKLRAVVAELREYADNPGYSHGDYADTMREAAGAIEAMCKQKVERGAASPPPVAAPLYDLTTDKDFVEDFERLASGITNPKQRKLVAKSVKQAIAAHGAAERERGRQEARAALAAAAPQAQAEPVVFPPLPRSVFTHPAMGEMWDRFAMHQYAMKYSNERIGAYAPTSTADAKDAARYRKIKADNDACRDETFCLFWDKDGNLLPVEGDKMDADIDAAIASSADEVKP